MHAASQLPQERSHRSLQLDDVTAQLTADGVITPKDAESILRHGATRSQLELHPFVVIANRGVRHAKGSFKSLAVEDLMIWLAGKSGIPYRRVDPLKIDVTAVTNLVSHAYASARRILPIATDGNSVVIATADPYAQEWVDELGRALRKTIVRVLVSPLDIGRYLDEFYSVGRALQRAASDAAKMETSGNVMRDLEHVVELGQRGQLDANDHHIVSIVDWLLQYAFEQRASDVHLEPRREKSEVRFRIDGVLHLAHQVPTPVMAAIVSRIKALGRMDVAEKRRPLDGRLKMKTPQGGEVELRLSTVPTALGEKMVMRIFDPGTLVKSLGELGLTDNEVKRWDAMINQPHGIILVTGPTGSGKTTTLYSTLKRLATPDVNVCTIEDPIEMVEPRFNQMQAQPQIGLNFAGGVRALLRQDPDIIMIGEIRDLETAEIAVQAALTGHLVLSTLHTNDAPLAITRLLELGVAPYLINATLLCIIAQRLPRSLCAHCKQPGKPDLDAWQALVQPWKVAVPETSYEPKGCLECRNSGYRGRAGIYELLELSPSIRRLIVPNAEAALIREVAIKEGLRPLRISGARKVASGITTIDEVGRVAPPPVLH